MYNFSIHRFSNFFKLVNLCYSKWTLKLNMFLNNSKHTKLHIQKENLHFVRKYAILSKLHSVNQKIYFEGVKIRICEVYNQVLSLRSNWGPTRAMGFRFLLYTRGDFNFRH